MFKINERRSLIIIIAWEYEFFSIKNDGIYQEEIVWKYNTEAYIRIR